MKEAAYKGKGQWDRHGDRKSKVGFTLIYRTQTIEQFLHKYILQYAFVSDINNIINVQHFQNVEILKRDKLWCDLVSLAFHFCRN